MKKIFPILFALVLALGVFLCSCKNDSADGANTNTNTNTDSASNNTNTDTGTNTGSAGTNTNTNTGTGTNTNTNTGSSGSDNTTEQGPTYDTVIEHGLRVEDMITGIDGIFDSGEYFWNHLYMTKRSLLKMSTTLYRNIPMLQALHVNIL